MCVVYEQFMHGPHVQAVLRSDVVYPQPKPWWGIELNATFTNLAANLTLHTPGEITVGFGDICFTFHDFFIAHLLYLFFLIIVIVLGFCLCENLH